MIKNIPPFCYYALCYLAVGVVSYQGALNPYPMGLLDTVSVSLVLIGILIFVGYRSQTAQAWTHLALLLTFAFITISSWFYFDYFQSLFTLSILSLGADMNAGVKALTFEPYGWTMIGLLAICLVFSLLGAMSRAFNARGSSRVGLAMLGLGAAGLVTVESSLAVYQDRDLPWLHPGNLHPIHALFKSETVRDAGSQAHRDALAYFTDLNQPNPGNISANNPDDTFSGPKYSQQQQTDYNLIIILLESFRADLVGTYVPEKKKNTPVFDQVAASNIFASNYYSNTTHTISAELSIWCGIFDLPGTQKFSYQQDKKLNVDCLPTILKQQGYESIYYHGNTGEFYNRNEFIPKIGFTDSYFHQDQADQDGSGKTIGWGVDDVSMFIIMQNQLERRNPATPFFAHLTTLSNHYPFEWDLQLDLQSLPYPRPHGENTLFENYQNAIFYTDHALGSFWQDFKASPLSSNTVVVILSDHGIWHFDETESLSLPGKNEKFYRAPLAIYHPDLQEPFEIKTLGSHIDILPTVLDLMAINFGQRKFFGKSLVASEPLGSSWAIMNKGIDHILRQDDFVCYFNVDQCPAKQQDCDGWRGEFVFSTESSPLVTCKSIEGDLLGKYSLEDKPAVVERFEQAKLAIEHQIQQAIGPK